MGRRKLPKQDPNVDISRHLFELIDIPVPFSRASWFGPDNSRALEIEIGSGKGLFLLNESGMKSDTDFIGLEISKKYCRYAAYRLAQAGRNNARMIRGDAATFLEKWIGPSSVAALHVYFPDPWWKERHRRRRIIRDDVVLQAARVLVSGGRLHFWTDVEEYFESGKSVIGESPDFEGPFDDSHTDSANAIESGDKYHTHFEKRMLVNEHDIFRCRFTRK